MKTTGRRPFSPWRHSIETALSLAAANVFLVLRFHLRGALYFDLFCVGLFAFTFVATRLWPDKVHFRRAAE